jgi:hypothetical protein
LLQTLPVVFNARFYSDIYRARTRHLTAQHLTLPVVVSTQWNGKILRLLLKIILTPAIRTSSAIKIRYFPHTAIPSDITSGSPNPNGWELPQANFAYGSGRSNEWMNIMNIAYIMIITSLGMVFCLIVIINLAILIVLEAFLPRYLYTNPFHILPLSCY